MQPLAFTRPYTTQIGAIHLDAKNIAALKMAAAGADDRVLYETILTLAQHRPAVRESLAAALADQVIAQKGYGDAGGYARDTIAPETHPHPGILLSHYDRASASANAFVTMGDPVTGEIYVLLGAKRGGQGVKEYVPPGGHMEIHPSRGASPRPFDQNLTGAAIRELEEETGLKITGYAPQSIATRSDYGVIGPADRHMVAEDFHFNLIGRREQLPMITPRDDLIEASWVNARNIAMTPQMGAQPHGSPFSRFHVLMQEPEGQRSYIVRDQYGPSLLKAVERARLSLGQYRQSWAARVETSPSQPWQRGM